MGVGGGGKIGGGLPPSVKVAEAAKKSQQKDAGAASANTPAKAADKFEKTAARAQNPRAGDMRGEPSQSTDVLRLARDNPAAARQLALTMRGQAQEVVSKLRQEWAGARSVLQQLGAERFSKEELGKGGKELRRKREKIMRLKMRQVMGERKLALLENLAGRLGDPRLSEELDRLLNHHGRLQSDWGRRHHLLGLGEYLYADEEDTPEHLQQVVCAAMRGVKDAESAGLALQDVSPHRVIAELIARTIDGSTVTDTHESVPLSGAGSPAAEPGSALQTWKTLRQTIAASLAVDPLARGDRGSGEGA